MLNPIKRVWVPKTPAAQAPASETPRAQAPLTKPSPFFEEVPEPEVEEKFSDSVWAAFNSIIPSPQDKT